MAGVIELNGVIAAEEATRLCAKVEKADPGLTERRRFAIDEEGYKDEFCPECGRLFMAHEHFIRCDKVRHKECPMHDGKPSLLDQIIDMTHPTEEIS